MAFRVKDLLINVASENGDGPEGPKWPCWGTFYCHWSTTTHPTTLLVAPFIACPGPTVIGPVGGGPPGDPGLIHSELVKIKQRLSEVLKEVEQQLENPPKPGPQTIPEIERLQEKMREALSELERRKAELRDRK